MDKPKYNLANLVYGETYTNLFLSHHVKSLLDDTNLPKLAEKYDIEYTIHSDEATAKALSYHPGMIKLSKIIKFKGELFVWPKHPVNRFAYRYGFLLNMLKISVEKAIKEDAVLSCLVADFVFAKEFFPRVLAKIEDGHDAVFAVPLRAAVEPMTQQFREAPGAMADLELCSLGLSCVHPLWLASLWHAPMFTKLPFTLLWNMVGGLLARSFSVTPLVFKPKPELLTGRGMIDSDVPQHFSNPFWATEWTDAPVIGAEPLVCYYPTFANRPASVGLLADWMGSLESNQAEYLKRKFFYPNEKLAQVPEAVMANSDDIVNQILLRAKPEAA